MNGLMWVGKNGLRWLGIAVVVMSSAIAVAQLTVGDNLKMNLNGNLGFGYSGEFGDSSIQSSHGQGVNGDANLTGYYFHPNFLSFEFRPYYERSQLNSDSQTITTGSGLGASVALFSGSHFPFSASYGKAFSSSDEFRVAGVPGLFGSGSGQNINLTWSELLPKWPQFWASYNINSNSNSLIGINGTSQNSNRSLNLNSDYVLSGFNLRAYFNHQTNSFTSPEFLETLTLNGGGSSNSYGVQAQHRLPWAGSFSAGWSHGSYSSNNQSSALDGMRNETNASTNNVSATANVVPWTPISIAGSVSYTTNLTAALGESIAQTGGIPILLNDQGSNSLNTDASVSWSIWKGLSATGRVSHRLQTFDGREYSDTQYGGVVNYRYFNRLFGLLYFGLGAVDTANKQGNQGVGLNANVGMNRRFGRWDTSADFSYAQNVNTLIVFNTSSSYSYGASVRRKINSEINWGGFFRGLHSGVSPVSGTSNHSENFATSIGWRRYSISGTYAQATGTALLTTSGVLTPTPIAGLITDEFLTYNATSYGGSLSMRILRPMSFALTYSNVKSSTVAPTLNSFNNGQRYAGRLEYKLRKFSIIGGFTRTDQAVSSSNLPRQLVNSYYFTLTRWFNVF